MADLIIRPFYQCRDLSETTVVGSGGSEYTLRNSKGQWSCECAGFTFRGRCKHIERHMANGCRWHQQFDGGKPLIDKDGEDACPNCGKLVDTVSCAV